jgi:hypothetical protein
MQAWCVDCRALSTKTETLYELGAEGWRVVGSANGAHFEWRCPACWLAFKELMQEASASSARFRAAAPVSSTPPAMAPGGDGESSLEDTCEDGRATMIVAVIVDVFRLLSPILTTVPASARARDLHARAERHASVVSQWDVMTPGEEEQIALFDEASRLHADASALVTGYRRGGRVSR